MQIHRATWAMRILQKSRQSRLPGRGIIIALLALSILPRAHAANVDIDIHLGYPPPPAIIFEREPELIVVPKTRVYYLPSLVDYDLYRYGDWWYVNKGGYWYRANSWQGPFITIRTAPRVILSLPGTYRRHPLHPRGGPPGQLKKMGVAPLPPPGHRKKGGKHK